MGSAGGGAAVGEIWRGNGVPPVHDAGVMAPKVCEYSGMSGMRDFTEKAWSQGRAWKEMTQTLL